MKKKITFGSIENQGDDFLRYSRSLSYSERLDYLGELRKRAFGKKYEEALEAQKKGKKKVVILSAMPGEALEAFYKRIDQFKKSQNV
jgi:hypothetical protein